MRFTLTVAGEVQLDREFEGLDAHAHTIDNVLRDIARDLNNEARQQFATQGMHASGGWKPLSDAYRKRKARMVQQGKLINGRPARHMQILRLTDRLRKSLVEQHDPEHVETIVNHELSWGSRVPYMRYHQNPGNPARRRRVIELNEKKRQQYARAILTHLRTGHSGL